MTTPYAGEIGRQAARKIHQDVHPTEAGAQKDAEHTSWAQAQNVGQPEVLCDLNPAGKDEDQNGKDQG